MHTSYTTQCNGVVSHGGQFGGLRVFADHIRKNTRKTNVFTIFARRAAFALACLHAQIAVHMHPTNRDYFDYGKNPKTPQIQPYARIKMAQGSLVYICG